MPYNTEGVRVHIIRSYSACTAYIGNVAIMGDKSSKENRFADGRAGKIAFLP